MNDPRRAAVLVLLSLLLAAPGCKRDERDNNAPREPAAAPSAPSRPAGAPTPVAREAATIWQQHCSRCHQREELADKTVADIKRSMETVPTMKPLQGQFMPQELERLEALLKTRP